MKRIISFICVLSLILGCVPAEIFAASDDAKIIVNETFNNIATNGVPENVAVKKGNDARVVEYDSSDKALYAKADGGAVKISVPIGENYGKMVFSFDLMIEGAPVKGDAVSLVSSSTKTLLTFSPNRTVTLEDGMDIGGYSNGKWTSYTLAVDFDSSLYSMYINGGQKFASRRFYSAPSKPKSMDFNFSCVNDGDVSEIYMDNIRVYEGSKILGENAFPKQDYNKEVLPFDTGAKEEKVYETVFIDSNGKKGIGAFSMSPKADTVAEWAPMEEGGTAYIHFKKTGDNDVFGDLTPSLYDGLDKYVYQTDVFVVNNQSNIIVARSNDRDGAVEYSNLLYISGSNLKLGDQILGKIDFGKWVNLAIAVDLLKESQTVYVNREPIAVDIPVHNGAVIPKTIRIGFTSGSSTNSEVYFNKIKLYDGLTLRTFEGDNDNSVSIDENAIMIEGMKNTKNETDAMAKDLLGSDVMFLTRNTKFYAKGEKRDYADFGKNAYLEDGKVMVDVKVLEYALDESFEINDGKIIVNKTSVPVVSKDGAYFADIAAVGKAMSKFVYDESDGRNFVIISGTNSTWSNNVTSEENQEPIDVVWRYLQFDRPSADDIYNHLVNGGSYKQHPRLLIKKDEVAQLKSRIDTNPQLRRILNSVLASANQYFEKAPIKREYAADGFRIFSSCANVKTRLFDLCTVYLLTGDEKYAERAWLEIENACNWEDWNVSVHFLDSGEIGPGIAYAYDVLYDYLTDEQKAFIRQKVSEKYLDFCVGVYTGNSNYDPMSYKNTACNWGAVCGASMLMVALTFMDEEAEDSILTQKCKYIVSNALQTFEHIVTAAAPEGHWYEGMGYYEYIQQHLAWCLESCDNILGKDYNFLTANGVTELTEYVMYMSTNNGGYNKSATTGVVSVFAPESFIYARLAGKPDIMGLYADYRKAINVNSYLPQYLLFYDPEYADHNYTTTLPFDRYYSSNGVGVIRSSWTDAEGLYVGMSGGTTSTYGDTHYDKGSFIFESQGIRWSIDLGRNGNSTMPYLSRAETHSALVINPTIDSKGQAYGVNAEVIKQESKPRGAYMVYDLTGVYGEWVNDYKRGFLVSDDRNTLTIRDEVSLKGKSDLKWNLITKASLEISADGKSAVLTQDGKKLKATAICSVPDWKFETADMAPTGGWADDSSGFTPQQQKDFAGTAKKLILSANASGNVQITVKLTPVIEGETYSDITDTAISAWTIPDGEIPPKPEASAIYADGKLIDGFLPGIKTYNISCVYGSPLPVFTADAPLGSVEVKQPSSFSDYASVTVTLSDGRKAVYRIYFEVTARITDAFIDTAPQLALPVGTKLLDIANVRSDHEPQGQNPAVHVADGNLSTYWASNEKGRYVEVDLGQIYDLSGIALGFMDGDTRNYKYDILISEDKMDYKRIYSGYSLGGTLDYEFLPANVKARYVRYVGFQHKTGTWNSISEVRPVIVE